MTDTTTTIADAATPAPSDRPRLDASLPVEERVELLLAEMTVEEKAGLFFQTMIVMGEGGELSEGDSAFGIPSNREYVAGRHMNHFNLLGVAPKASHIAAPGLSLNEWRGSVEIDTGMPRRVDAASSCSLLCQAAMSLAFGATPSRLKWFM